MVKKKNIQICKTNNEMYFNACAGASAGVEELKKYVYSSKQYPQDNPNLIDYPCLPSANYSQYEEEGIEHQYHYEEDSLYPILAKDL